MTTPRTTTVTGQDIGAAERATRALLDRLLAATGTDFTGWVLIDRLHAAGGALPGAALLRTVAGGLRITEATVVAALTGLTRDGLVESTSDVTLTEAGRDRYATIQAGIDALAERLYGGLPTEDLVTARRILVTVTERATAELG
ncbi:MAG TPA: hypothetical protein VHV74_04445 [Pseudonocardiaceae bacterium]|jgi:DNA-binding MarR family transcriptional regulator|nr:hypothetical protein [Pseudonocardiaceae bacterium]